MSFFKKIKNLKNTQFKFSLPRKNKIVFYDSFIFDDSGQKFLDPYIKSTEITNLDIRFKEIYLFILIKAILKNGFKKDVIFNYALEFIGHVKPNLVLSFLDSDIKFYKLKKNFTDIKFVIFQTGYRSINNVDLFSKLKTNIKKEDLSADFVLAFGRGVAKEYERYIKCRAIPIGSFKNNCFSSKKVFKNFSKIKDIYFISQFRSNIMSGNRVQGLIEGIPRKIFYKPESILLPKLQKKCLEKGYLLNILGCSMDVEEEYKFFKEILQSSEFKHLKLTDSASDQDMNKLKNIKSDKVDLIRSLKDGGIGSYIKLNYADIVFFIDSTLGYEALSLGHRCASFHCREATFKNSDILGNAGFGWPSIQKNQNGNFWTNLQDEKEADRIIDYILNVSEEDWSKDLNLISDVMSYDDGNKRFKDILNSIDAT